MKIAIMGAGAMGCMFGARLSKSGHEIWLIVKRESDSQAIKERGVILHMGGIQEVAKPKATTNPADVGTADVVIFLVKSFDTAVAAQQARPMIGPNTYAMTLQNGIGNVETIASELGMERIVLGATFAGGSLKGPGYVEIDALSLSHAPTKIGEWRKKNGPIAFEICDAFNAAGIPTVVSEDAEQILWSTVAAKSAVMMATAVTRLRVGDLLELDEGKELVSLAMSELLAVANAKGIKGLDQTLDQALTISTETSRGHITSLLAAVLAEKRTEVDCLGGAIAREAERLGLSAPANKTLALLIRIIEKTYDRSIRD